MQKVLASNITWCSIFSLDLGPHKTIEQSKQKSASVDLLGTCPELHVAKYENP
jgi:hypothetical protein